MRGEITGREIESEPDARRLCVFEAVDTEKSTSGHFVLKIHPNKV